jgi:hypothetical protein
MHTGPPARRNDLLPALWRLPEKKPRREYRSGRG